MLMQKRPRAFSSSNEINETEWPCSFPIKRERSRLTEEDVRRVIKEELEHANSHSAKYCQSCTGKACEEMMKQMRPMMNSFLKELKEALGLGNIQIPHAGRAHVGSTINNYARNLQLQFQTKLSLPIYTGKILKGQNSTPISVALINADTGNVVTSGPESSIKLEVVVLEGNFDKEDGDNWTSEEFEDHVVKERDGKRPLLIGNLPVTLKGGVGELGELTFTDNSSWNKSGRFRIGIKVASDCCGNTRIREAKTEAFRVMEYRGAANEKHYPPASKDEVWRLEKIRKEGKYHLNLKAAGIHTVEDFILQLHTDFQKLREILGISVTSKNWDILVHHANTCKINRKLYLYHPECMEMHGVIFTLPSQLIGLIKGGEYFASHRLSPQEMKHGDSIVQKALQNWNAVRKFNGAGFSGSMQKKSSSSSSSQVIEGQTQNLTSIQRGLDPPVLAAQVGLEALPTNVGSTPEGQSQNTNSENFTGFPVDEIAPVAAHQPMSADQNANFGNAMDISFDKVVPLASHQAISAGQNANFGNAMMSSVDQPSPADNSHVVSPGDNGITTVGLPNQSHDTDLRYAMAHSTIDPLRSPGHAGYMVSNDVLPSGPTYASTSGCQYSGTCPPREGNHMEDYQSIVPEEFPSFWSSPWYY